MSTTHQIKKTAHDTADGLVDSLKKTAQDAQDGVMEVISDAGDRIVELRDEATRTLGKRIDALGAAMKKHPLAAAGLALGIGYLIARIVHR